MDLGWIADGLLLVLLIVLFLMVAHSNAEWQAAIGYERKERREGICEEQARRWELRNEVESGFEALGLVKRPREPARGPSWVKKTD